MRRLNKESIAQLGQESQQHCTTAIIRVVPDFGSGKSEMQPFSEIRPSPAQAKFLAGSISVDSVTSDPGETNASDLSSGVGYLQF